MCPILYSINIRIVYVHQLCWYFATHENPTALGAATYFATGALQGALISSGAVLLAGSAILGEVAERAVDKESLTDNPFDYVAEGALAVGSAKLANTLLSKATGSKNIKYLTRVFTTKSGQQFVTNQLAENIAIISGQNSYYNYANAMDNSNKVDIQSSSSKSGGSGGYASVADKSSASSQLKKLQSSGFIKISSGFAKLASSRGINVS